ncbi:MAG: haloacid dehalogenase-like hydrolase [Rhodobacteraceae bacterium]|nr:haloacid dehalogenase-like hydrolase [Paracoccaceae bacterium]
MRHCLLALVATTIAWPALADPMPSWRDTDTKARIVAFVDAVTDPASPDHVAPADRIAVFDNDGTLWAEKPVYFQLLYALDRLQKMAADDPSILTTDALKAAAAGDMQALAATGEHGLLEVIGATHSGMSVDAFIADAADWLATATHPGTGLRYAQMTYAPMIELLGYLRDEGFATYIVSGGGVHFIRAFSQDAYGIPPEQVIGSVGESAYELVDGVPTLVKKPGIAFIDDKEGKPVGIDRGIGKRPILAVGNSDGDFQMLEWTTASAGARLGVLIHHTDADRAFAYDRDSAVGSLARGLDEGPDRGWVIVDMKADWDRVWTGE